MFFTMAVEPGRVLTAALIKAEMQQKEAAIFMGIGQPHLTRMLQGEVPFDLRRVLKLPWRVFAAFWSQIVAARAVEFSDELRAEKAVMARADLREPQRKSEVA